MVVSGEACKPQAKCHNLPGLHASKCATMSCLKHYQKLQHEAIIRPEKLYRKPPVT